MEFKQPFDLSTVPCRNLRALLVELIAISAATWGKGTFHLDLRPVGDDFDSSACVGDDDFT